MEDARPGRGKLVSMTFGGYVDGTGQWGMGKMTVTQFDGRLITFNFDWKLIASGIIELRAPEQLRGRPCAVLKDHATLDVRCNGMSPWSLVRDLRR